MVTYHADINFICIFFEYFLKYPQYGVVKKWKKMENEMVKFIGGGMGKALTSKIPFDYQDLKTFEIW